MSGAAAAISRADVEDFLYAEAAALDAWQLDAWLTMLTDDARYEVPPNDQPFGNADDTLFIIADDIDRIRARVKRLKSPGAHAEYPKSRTRRNITNVRIIGRDDADLTVTANFMVHRFRSGARIGVFVGAYDYQLRVTKDGLKIAKRVARIDSLELGSLGSVSFIL